MNGAMLKVVIASMTSALLSGGAVWASLIGRVPSREEVSRMIQVESPYVADRGTIAVRLTTIDGRLERIEKNLAVLTTRAE